MVIGQGLEYYIWDKIVTVEGLDRVWDKSLEGLD